VYEEDVDRGEAKPREASDERALDACH
jgi:hypothetical protein